MSEPAISEAEALDLLQGMLETLSALTGLLESVGISRPQVETALRHLAESHNEACPLRGVGAATLLLAFAEAGDHASVH